MHLYCKSSVIQQHWHATKRTHACTPLHLLVSCDSVVTLSQLELQSAVCLLYQPLITAECKTGVGGGTEMLGATCCNAVLCVTNVKWTTLGQDTGICVGRPKLLYTPNRDYTKILRFSLVLNTLLNRLSSKCTVSLQLLVSINLHCYSGNYSPSLRRKCIKICIVLCFWYSYWWGRLERSLLGKCYIVLNVKW